MVIILNFVKIHVVQPCEKEENLAKSEESDYNYF